jgi:ribosomal protein RSM22 (predicted rRNA methylase)
MRAVPQQIQLLIERLVEFIPHQELITAAQALTENYRAGAQLAPLNGRAQHLAYLVARFPATFAAIFSVLQQAKKRLPGLCFSSLLDMGAGPGSASLAALLTFEGIQKITMRDRDSYFLEKAEEFLAKMGMSLQVQAICQDFEQYLAQCEPYIFGGAHCRSNPTTIGTCTCESLHSQSRNCRKNYQPKSGCCLSSG